jgi:adenosine deaminase
VSQQEVDAVLCKGQRQLADCFKLFDIIHRITTTHEVITRITQEVIRDFQHENVIYLELRTTPKARPELGMTKRSYVEAVLQGMQQHLATQLSSARLAPTKITATASDPEAAHKPPTDADPDNPHPSCDQHSTQSSMTTNPASSTLHGARTSTPASIAPLPTLVHLLLSIDRRETTEAALETVELAASLQHRGVVGIDLSGNPYVGSWQAWQPALARARALGLRVTLHAGEVPNSEEVAAMLAFRPDRLGHMCCMDQELEEQLLVGGVGSPGCSVQMHCCVQGPSVMHVRLLGSSRCCWCMAYMYALSGYS